MLHFSIENIHITNLIYPMRHLKIHKRFNYFRDIVIDHSMIILWFGSLQLRWKYTNGLHHLLCSNDGLQIFHHFIPWKLIVKISNLLTLQFSLITRTWIIITNTRFDQSFLPSSISHPMLSPKIILPMVLIDFLLCEDKHLSTFQI